MQGIGWALLEELDYNEDGQLLMGRSPTTRCLRPTEVPSIETLIVEVPAPDGPFGPRVSASRRSSPQPPAIANAISDATGVRLTELPMTPARVWNALT